MPDDPQKVLGLLERIAVSQAAAGDDLNALKIATRLMQDKIDRIARTVEGEGGGKPFGERISLIEMRMEQWTEKEKKYTWFVFTAMATALGALIKTFVFPK